MNEHNFYSIDRMVEFGMGLALAQQMAKSMNAAIQNTPMPGLETPQLSTNPSIYHVAIEGKAAGPFSESELLRLISEGKVTKNSYVWRPGMPQWATAENSPDILKLVALTPPPLTYKG